MKKGFTLIELLAVVVVLSIILAVAVPNIMLLIKNTTINAFSSNSKLLWKAIDIKKMNDNNFDLTTINEANLSLINISNTNYEKVSISMLGNNIYTYIKGKNQWSGYTACGVKNNFIVFDSSVTSDCLTFDFKYTGSEQTFKVPINGIYKLEAWGAEGGNRGAALGGKGGYSSGYINLSAGEELYTYVGGMGNGLSKGYNGGGIAGYPDIYGGGASDIRKDGRELNNRILVAGGGGSVGAPNKTGGAGGGAVGETRTDPYGTGGTGGNQISGGNSQGSFGIGGNGLSSNGGYGGAGGGGYYGGGGVTPDRSADDERGGGGGSGYIGGVLSGETIVGTNAIKNPDNTETIGRSGNGYIRISYISNTEIMLIGSDTIYLELGTPYVEPGFFANSLTEGNITLNVITTNNININVSGIYNVNYSVVDSKGDTTTKNRTVVVSNVFNYTGDSQTFTASSAGKYKLEVWGAEGGGSRLSGNTGSGLGGKGGYSVGTINLSAGQSIYIFIGGYGSSSNSGVALGGYNGGGTGYGSVAAEPGNGGGGATDIRLINGVWNDSNSLNSRIIVAGGGGGGGEDVGDAVGAGGGLQGSGYPGYDGTQTAAGNGGALGIGGSTNLGDGGGGGGGYYGGGTLATDVIGTDTQGGGGGSGYIGGVASGQTIAGNVYMLDSTGIYTIGHEGNGCAKITYLGS